MGISVPHFLKSVQVFGKLVTTSVGSSCQGWVRGGASGHFHDPTPSFSGRPLPQLFYWLFSLLPNISTFSTSIHPQYEGV